jgi:hypothetical protein
MGRSPLEHTQGKKIARTTASLERKAAFVETWGVKYDKAVECLIKDRDALLGFYVGARIAQHHHRVARGAHEVQLHQNT